MAARPHQPHPAGHLASKTCQAGFLVTSPRKPPTQGAPQEEVLPNLDSGCHFLRLRRERGTPGAPRAGTVLSDRPHLKLGTGSEASESQFPVCEVVPQHPWAGRVTVKLYNVGAEDAAGTQKALRKEMVVISTKSS